MPKLKERKAEMKRVWMSAVMIAAIALTGSFSYAMDNSMGNGVGDVHGSGWAGPGVGAQPQITMGASDRADGQANSYYVDCGQVTNGVGTRKSPWNSLAAAMAQPYQSGDRILFRRGATCEGQFTPHGSGTAAAPIIVTAYGHGPLPVIDGGSANNAAFYLTNQSYWTIENLDLLEGKNWGLVAKALGGTDVYGLTIKNVIATGATSVAYQRALSGEIGLLADGTSTSTISDVNISHVTVGNTKAGEGIFVKAGQHGIYYGPKGQDISVTRSIVSDVYGDGLLVTDAENVTLSHNIVTKSGECPDCTGSTPGALWVWDSVNVEMSWNESYGNTSWGVDGGGMDIDYLNRYVTVEDNYIHDNKGYCVSVFGAGKNVPTEHAVVRFNVCANNDAQPTTTQNGDFLVTTWNNGTINGVQIYNNTVYWDAPRANNYVLQASTAQFSGTIRNFFMNNVIYTPLQHPYLIAGRGQMQVNHNLYYSPNATESTFMFYGTTWNDFATYQTKSGQDQQTLTADPVLGDAGYHDLRRPSWQYSPQNGSAAIGAGVNVCAGYPANVCSMGTTDFLGAPLSTTSPVWMGAIQETVVPDGD
jgi:hypothetical protein